MYWYIQKCIMIIIRILFFTNKNKCQCQVLNRILDSDWRRQLAALSLCTFPLDFYISCFSTVFFIMCFKTVSKQFIILLTGDNGSTHALYLETIVEETSDDLRSERSSAATWLSDSDADSVIHVRGVAGMLLVKFSY